MYAWEPSFSQRVKGVRKDEMFCVRRQAFILGAIDVTIVCAPYLVRHAIIIFFLLWLFFFFQHFASHSHLAFNV